MRRLGRAEVLLPLLIAAAAVALLLARGAEKRVNLEASHSGVIASRIALSLPPKSRRCQNNELVPSSAVSARVFVSKSPPNGAAAFRIDAQPRQGRRFTLSSSPDTPSGTIELKLAARRRTLDPVRICFVNTGRATLSFAGNLTPANPAAPPGAPGIGRRPGDEIRIDFLGRPESWLGSLRERADRWAMFRPFGLPPGALWGILFLAAALGALATWLAVRSPSGTRSTALAAAAIALGLAMAWSLVTPPFQGPDESAHVAYADYVGRTWSLPGRGPAVRGAAELPRRLSLLYAALPFSVEGSPSWSSWNEREWRRRDARTVDAPGSGVNYTKNNPPLYYAIEGAAAAASWRWGPLEELAVMRLVSAVIGAVSVLFVFLFLLELWPRGRGPAFAGALAVGMSPMFSFLAGAVTVDNLLFAVAAAVFWLTARILRRGLSLWRGVALAAACLLGVLTKSTIFALLPGALLALVIAFVRLRARRGTRAAALPGLLPIVAFSLGLAAWLFVNGRVLGRAGTTTAGFASSPAGVPKPQVGELVSYLWQFYLPRLPFMTTQFPDYPTYPVWDVLFKGFVGRFGWFQYNFGDLVNGIALVVAILLGLMAARTIVPRMLHERSFAAEALVWATMIAGAVSLLAYAGYTYRLRTGLDFEQTRHLLILLPLYGAIVTAAVAGLRRQWRPAAIGSLVAVFAVHEVGALLLTVSRYYG